METIPRHNDRGRAAFTLLELMISLSIFTMVLGGVVYSHFIGTRLFQLANAKLTASHQARKAFNNLHRDIRTAKVVRLGQGDRDGFIACSLGLPQQGNAVEVIPGTDPDLRVRYYLDASDHCLWRQELHPTNPPAGRRTRIAENVTNALVFAAEDSLGRILTNRENNRVISAALHFSQIQYPVVRIGPGEDYDYYQLRTKVTRRMLE